MNQFTIIILFLQLMGTKSEIPNTPESREWVNIKDYSLNYTKPARVLVSTIIDVKYGIVLDSIIGKIRFQ